MIRALVVVAMLAPACALAQSAHDHAGMGSHHATRQPMASPDHGPTQPGQAAFAAIQEIVGILESDPETDWARVDIEALRRHLVDMNNVTLSADVKTEPAHGGMRFVVTGAGPVRDSIRRMVVAHAATMNGDGWTFAAADVPDGAALTVGAPARDADKLKGLGFMGVMTRGMHHQAHHLMIARGARPHH